MEINVRYLTQEEVRIKDAVLYKLSVYDNRFDKIINVWTTKKFDLKNNSDVSLIYDYSYDYKKSTYKLKLIDIDILK